MKKCNFILSLQLPLSEPLRENALRSKKKGINPVYMCVCIIYDMIYNLL